jgi:hypothetical protein
MFKEKYRIKKGETLNEYWIQKRYFGFLWISIDLALGKFSADNKLERYIEEWSKK